MILLARSSVFLTAEWRDLVMLNYSVDPAVLEKHVPAGTILDTWNGTCYLSLVAFRFLRTRVRGIAFPWHRDFEEINLRFYVRREVDGEIRRGVVFIKEIVPRRAIALAARVLYNENYVAMPTGHDITRAFRPDGEPSLSVAYTWRTGGVTNRAGVRASGEPSPLVTGSEEEYITEHYWGFAAQRNGSTLEYRVEHPRWRVWRADEASLDCDAALTLYGPEFARILEGPPVSALLAEGSPVTVHKGVRVPGTMTADAVRRDRLRQHEA